MSPSKRFFPADFFEQPKKVDTSVSHDQLLRTRTDFNSSLSILPKGTLKHIVLAPLEFKREAKTAEPALRRTLRPAGKLEKHESDLF